MVRSAAVAVNSAKKFTKPISGGEYNSITNRLVGWLILQLAVTSVKQQGSWENGNGVFAIPYSIKPSAIINATAFSRRSFK